MKLGEYSTKLDEPLDPAKLPDSIEDPHSYIKDSIHTSIEDTFSFFKDFFILGKKNES